MRCFCGLAALAAGLERAQKAAPDSRVWRAARKQDERARNRKRVDDFDFDITVQRFGFSSTPGDSLRTFFSSQAAAMRGSQNLAGISDPVIDALIDKVIAADSRASLTTSCRALDRVIRTGRYWVPH